MIPLDTKFQRKFAKHPDGCWLWTGSKSKAGYGRFTLRWDGKRQVGRALAHRWAYERWVGPIPEGLVIDHLCDVTSCVNPAHLAAVTPRENWARSNIASAVNARKTHCNRGHELLGANLRMDPSGRRVCRACCRFRKARSRAERS